MGYDASVRFMLGFEHTTIAGLERALYDVPRR